MKVLALPGFQFHKVRLKEGTDQLNQGGYKFQFHKVRLKAGRKRKGIGV